MKSLVLLFTLVLFNMSSFGDITGDKPQDLKETYLKNIPYGVDLSDSLKHWGLDPAATCVKLGILVGKFGGEQYYTISIFNKPCQTAVKSDRFFWGIPTPSHLITEDIAFEGETVVVGYVYKLVQLELGTSGIQTGAAVGTLETNYKLTQPKDAVHESQVLTSLCSGDYAKACDLKIEQGKFSSLVIK